MGSEDFYPEERPVRRVTVPGFLMDARQVTAAEYRRFVRETGYVTVAERPLDPADYPGRRPRAARARARSCSARRTGRCRSTTSGAGGSTSPALLEATGRAGQLDQRPRPAPGRQVAYEDAEAYAAWAGKELPTEAEWEFAARGGLDGATFAWGDEHTPGGTPMANTWQGDFPWQNLKEDGFEGTSPVGSFPPNGYGLYDMCGNVWEWTSDWFTDRHRRQAAARRRAARRRPPRRASASPAR